VPFLKFSRDKRGYENYYLFDGKARPRLLFWFRSPPNVRVGRAPFSEDVRKMVEAQNPGVHFDWQRIMSTPIPSADVEYWRERRRAEKAAKRAVREADAREAEEVAAQDAAAVEVAVAEESHADPVAVGDEETAPREDIEAITDAVTEAETSGDASDVQAAQPQPSQGHRRRRRRRRGRRGGGGPGGPAPPSTPEGPQGGEV